MQVLEFQWRKYHNVGSLELPLWSKGLTYTYVVDLKDLQVEKLPEGFLTNLLIKEAEVASSQFKRFVYISHEIKTYNIAEDEGNLTKVVRKLIASQISKQDDNN
jgi:hypothetical protein